MLREESDVVFTINGRKLKANRAEYIERSQIRMVILELLLELAEDESRNKCNDCCHTSDGSRFCRDCYDNEYFKKEE